MKSTKFGGNIFSRPPQTLRQHRNLNNLRIEEPSNQDINDFYRHVEAERRRRDAEMWRIQQDIELLNRITLQINNLKLEEQKRKHKIAYMFKEKRRN